MPWQYLNVDLTILNYIKTIELGFLVFRITKKNPLSMKNTFGELVISRRFPKANGRTLLTMWLSSSSFSISL